MGLAYGALFWLRPRSRVAELEARTRSVPSRLRSVFVVPPPPFLPGMQKDWVHTRRAESLALFVFKGLQDRFPKGTAFVFGSFGGLPTTQEPVLRIGRACLLFE